MSQAVVLDYAPVVNDPELRDLASGIGRSLEEQVAAANYSSPSWTFSRDDRGEFVLRHALAQAEVPVSARTVSRAKAFLWSLPIEAPLPDIRVEDDGEIVFDWDEASDRVFSVSIGEAPRVGYAGCFDQHEVYGRAPSPTGAAPEAVARVLRRLYR